MPEVYFEVCGSCGLPWNAGLHVCPDFPMRWSSRTKPWTFRRVYRIWGLWAAIRFLFRKDIEAVDGDEVLDVLARDWDTPEEDEAWKDL